MTLRRHPGFESPFYAANHVYSVVFTLGVLTTHTRNIAMQFLDPDGVALKTKGAVVAYISSDSAGLVLATPPGTSVLIGTHGLSIPLITSSVFQLVSDASGRVDLTMIDTGSNNYYLNLIMPDGSVITSPIIAL